MNFIPFSIGDLKLSVLSGVEACMSKSNIKISECYMGFLEPVGDPNQSAIFSTEGLLGIKISSCFLAFLSIQVPTVSMQSLISSKVGVISAVPSKHHSLAIPISRKDLNQFLPTVHVDQFC